MKTRPRSLKRKGASMSFSNPVTAEVLAALPALEARELRVKAKYHATGLAQLFLDLYLHSYDIKTGEGSCPWLAYIPAYFRLRNKPAELAAWMLRFVRIRHTETRKITTILSPGHWCKCDEELA
jgi:hypothetical protein